MTEKEILELAKQCGIEVAFDLRLGDVAALMTNELITFANAIAQRTRDECAEMILRTDLQALPDDWKNPAASFLLAYAESIRSMK